MKLNITMNDGSKLKDVYVFYNKNLGDSEMKTKKEFEDAMQNNKIIFFCGSYIQGGFTPKQVKSFEYINDVLTIYDLQEFEPKSEELAIQILNEINACNCIKGSCVQKLKEIIKRIEKYK